jgi:glycosyltransferase involved in cell wall biosynthesis
LVFHDYELVRYLPEKIQFNKKIFFVPLRIDLDRIDTTNSYFQTEHRLKIIHAPSDRLLKGTDFIINAINDLKLIYDFDFELLEKIDNKSLIEKLKESDIVIDQILIGSYGLFSIEAMYLGKPVICYIAEENKEHYPEDLPIFNANYSNIKERIEQLIINCNLRDDLGKQGYLYVTKYHDSDKIAQLLKEIYLNELDLSCRESFEYVSGISHER